MSHSRDSSSSLLVSSQVRCKVPNINLLLKLASASARLSFLTLIIAFSSSLLIPKANAAHFPVLGGGIVKTVKTVRTQNTHKLHANKLSARKSITLSAIRHALRQVADGSSYRWHHKRSRLTGRIRPTSTYFNTSGQLCRHIYISLSYITAHKNSQALACRNKNGQWTLKS